MSVIDGADQGRGLHLAARIVAVFALLFVFLVGVHGLGEGFKLLGRDLLDTFFRATENPFVGLVVGVLATTLVQSSSATTSMIVGLVAAPENPLPLANAVPMIMGANIGTTVTNTVVSLAHMGRPEEFRRAFAAATCHDFFNFITVLILLPVEMATGYLQRSAHFLSSSFEGERDLEITNPLKDVLEAGFTPVEMVAEAVFRAPVARGFFLAAVSGILIFFALFMLVKLLRSVVQSRVERILSAALEASAILAIGVGIAITVMVQSSSITTSLLVPLAGAGVIGLEQVFPVTVGANIGTTITGFVASLAVSGPNAAAGIEIALVHLLFNLTGTLLIYPWKRTRGLPLAGSRWLAKEAVASRKTALAYVFGLFYLLPALLIFAEKLIGGD